MTNNLIPNIAKMLGVEIGEKFKIEGDAVTYEFRAGGLYGNHGTDAEALEALICGNAEIIKQPLKPKAGEMYWTFGLYSLQDPLWVVTSARWRNSPSDMALLEHGWVFNSRKAAEKVNADALIRLAGRVTGFVASMQTMKERSRQCCIYA